LLGNLRPKLYVLVLSAILGATKIASAQSTTAAAGVRRDLKHDVALDGALTLGMAATMVSWAVLIKPSLPVPSCLLCDESGGHVNGLDAFFRTSLRAPSGSPVGTMSDVLAYGAAPVTGIGMALLTALHDDHAKEAPVNMLLIAEAALTFAVLQQGLTAVVPRERPGDHAARQVDPNSPRSRSSFESFPAGHNGAAFVIAAAGGTIATMRGYRLAPLVWIVGGAIAVTTSYLRMAADRHYFTDIISGAALGIGTGIAIPLLFHPRVGAQPVAGFQGWLRGAVVSTAETSGGRFVRVGGSF
jgi:membrane-associated phospholipid phosphatase